MNSYPPTRGSTRGHAHAGALFLLALSLAIVFVTGGCSGPAPAPPPPTTVQRSSVSTQLKSSGALASVTSRNIAFPKPAKLTEVNVRVGDKVAPGQVLARQDSFRFRQALAREQAVLSQEQARLELISNNLDASNSKRTLEQAMEIEETTKQSTDRQQALNEETVDRAGVALDDAQRRTRAARDRAEAADRPIMPCAPQGGPNGGAPQGGPNGGSSSDWWNLARNGSSGDNQGGNSRLSPGSGSPGGNRDGGSWDGRSSGNSWDSRGSGAYHGGRGGGRSGGRWPSGSSGGGGLIAACSTGDRAASDTSGARAAYEQAKSDEIAARTAYERAKKQQDVDRTQGQLAVNNAHLAVVQESNSLRTARTDKPSEVAAQAAAVNAQRAVVEQARRDVDETVLYAPAAGTVSVVNGTVGEFVDAGGGTTSLAPGSTAQIPRVGAPASSDQSGNSTAGSLSATSPGGRAFMVLNDIDSFQVVVPFQESDAAKVAPNQSVRVTFDAIPDLLREGTVLTVAPNGVNVSGVTNYYATILLTQGDPRMRDGQAAQTAVLINNMENVLVVPNEFVVKQNGNSYVNVPGPDGAPRLQQFSPGAVGDNATQVLSGLAEGQPILPPMSPPSGS